MQAKPWERYGQASQPETVELPRSRSDIEERDRRDREEGYDRRDRSIDVASSLRKEFQATDIAKNYNIALGTYNSALTTKPTAEGDQSLIVSFARMLDPNSVVREGEFVVAASNEAAFTRLVNDIKRQFGVDGAGRLSDQGRARLREEMRNLVVNRFKAPYDQSRQMYEGYARASGIDPALVVGQPPEAAFPKGILNEPVIDSAPEEMKLSTDGTKSVPLPQWYQDAVNSYLSENGRNLDPSQYAAFRVGLDEQLGIPGNIGYYVEDGQRIRDGLEQGGRLTAIPSTREVRMSPMEEAVTDFASTPFGAGVATFTNSATAGVPAWLAGGTEKLEAVRQNQPVAGFIGDLGGGIAGTMMMGGGLGALGARGLAANPMAQNAAFGAVSGATQSEDPLTGAAFGAVGSLGGDIAGRYAGRALPELFAPGSMRAARDAVPSIDDLKDLAARQYSAVEAAGAVADPAATADMLKRATDILTREGRMSPAGRLIDTDTPTTRAMTLLEDYAGQQMTPTQAGAVRSVLAEGLTGRDAAQKRISGMLLDEFDQWADPVLPGISVPRETASRYLQGQKIDEAIQLANADKSRLTQSGYENALRGRFRDLDRSTIRGTSRFDDEVVGAIEAVARGDALSNASRALGKFAPTSPMAMTVGGGAAGMLGNMAGGPMVGIPLGLLAAGAGTAGRKFATSRAEKAAANALNTALGGPQYQAMIQQAAEEAAMRGRRIGSGLFGSGAVIASRDGF